ncbi:MAG TPA: tetratricopeptide repeat protein [Myxococcales bacterium]|nr:tetratricopeptide repeat protein [Myxococcales bacterium]
MSPTTLRRRLAAVLVLSAATAVAQPQPSAPPAPAAPAPATVDSKAERKEAKDADLSKKAATTIDKSLAGDLTRKAEPKGPDVPTLNYDQFRLGVETQVAEKRHEQMVQLQKLLKITPEGDKDRPGLLFRLAELLYEESKDFFFQAGRKDDEYIKAFNKKDKAGMDRAKGEKSELEKKAEDYASKARDAYTEIAQKYRDYERSDEVLYFLGHAFLESKSDQEQKKALVVFERLIKKYPKSKYVPDAYLAFGEYYFGRSKTKADLGQIQKALEAYKAAAGFPENQVYAFALYKQGWCHFLLNDFQASMDKFKTVILMGELNGAGSLEKDGKGKGKATLIREARNDYVRAFERVGSPQEARSDFGKVASNPDDRWVMVVQLANLYYGEGKDKEAAITFNMLIKERPLSPEAPGFQAKIVDCILRAGNKKMTVQQVRKLVEVIDAVDKAKVVKTEKDQQALDDAKALSERTLSNLAVNWHNEAKKTRDDEVFALANDVYNDYLTLFPENPKAYDMRFFWAELLFDNLQKFDKAAQEYTRVVEQDVKKIDAKQKPGVRMVNAAYNSILAWDEVVKKAEEAGQLKVDTTDITKKAAIPAPKQGLLDACERYIKYVPGEDKKVEIAFKAANIYYRYNHFDEAVKRFADIALNHPDYKFEDGQRAGEVSANLVLDSYNLLGDWTKVNEWARKFYASDKLATGKFREDLAKVLEQSQFKLINQLEQRKDYARAAEAYLTFVKDFPRSEIADKAVFNASIDYFNAKMLDKAIQTRDQIIAQYPKSEHVPACIYANAEAREAVGDFEKAAEAYEKYVQGYERNSGGGKGKKAPPPPRAAKAKKGKKGEEAPPPKAPVVQKWDESKAQIALYNAGVFREGLGQMRQALKDREKYLDLWPKSKDEEAVFLSIADLYEKMGTYGKAVHQLEEYEKQWGKDPNKMLLAEARLVKIFEDKAKRPKEALRILARANKFYGTLGPTRRKALEPAAVEVAARGQLNECEEDYRFYTQAKLRWGHGGAPEKEFKETLQEKAKRMKTVIEDYTKTVKYNAGDTGICALHKIGLAYAHFAETLETAPMPRGANQELQDAIRDEMTKQAAAPKEKAAEAFAAAVAKAQELDIANECAKKSMALLRETYRPDKYPPLYEKFIDLKSVKGLQQGGDLLASIQLVPVLTEAQQQVAKEQGEELKQDLDKDLVDIKNGPPKDDEPPPRATRSASAAPPAADGKGKPPAKGANKDAEPTEEPEDSL